MKLGKMLCCSLLLTLLTVSAAIAAPRFTDNGDQTVTDNQTGLTWAKNANLAGAPMDWDTAFVYVASLNSANGGAGTFGHNDWRQPTASELMSLVDPAKSMPSLPAGHPFINVVSDEYWSSSSGTSSYQYAYGVNIGGGFIYSELDGINR